MARRGSRLVALVVVPAVGLVAGAFWGLTRLGAPAPGSGMGRELFLGQGRCHTCHALEPRAGAGAPTLRGPDLAGVGGRAGARVAGQDAATYLLEALVRPDAHAVPGFPPGLMPAAWDQPARLAPAEIRALVLFLMSLGGTPDRRALAAAERRLPIPPPVDPADPKKK